MPKQLLFLFFVFLCLPSIGQEVMFADSTCKSVSMKINKMGWLEGNWKSKGKKISIQESWTRNGAHSMMCVASIYESNSIILFEICTITEENGSLILRIRHFDAGLQAWEEKDKPLEKQLIKAAKNRIYFDGYTFEKTGKDQMTLFIQSKPENEMLTIPYVRN